jgi:transposase
MPSAVRLREDYSAEARRALARWLKDTHQSRRLLFLAAVRDGMDRRGAAKIGGMDRQTLRDWVHRFNAAGRGSLIDNWTAASGRDREKDGVARWRRIDLKRVIAERFGVEFHPRYVGKLLQKLGFSHIRARPRHPAQDERIVEAFKKRMARPVCKGFFERADDQSAATYPASEDSSQPRWRYARSGPHKLPGVERRFLNQAFGAPFDCQAISISPLANLIDRSAHFSALRLCPDQRLRRQGQSPDHEPFAAP